MCFLDIIQGIRDLSVLKSTVEQSDRKMIMSPNSQRKTSMSHFSHKKESQTKNELYEDPNYFLNESDLSSPKHGRLNMVSLCDISFNYKFVKAQTLTFFMNSSCRACNQNQAQNQKSSSSKTQASRTKTIKWCEITWISLSKCSNLFWKTSNRYVVSVVYINRNRKCMSFQNEQILRNHSNFIRYVFWFLNIWKTLWHKGWVDSNLYIYRHWEIQIELIPVLMNYSLKI